MALEIGAYVREARDAQRYSARALAEVCSRAGLRLNRARIADIESERRRPVSVEEWLLLAQVLEVPPVQLLVGERTPDDEHVALSDAVRVTVGELRSRLSAPHPGAGQPLPDPMVLGETFRRLMPLVAPDRHHELLSALLGRPEIQVHLMDDDEVVHLGDAEREAR
jgi:transcriptional regulator with XRE-family HTH domain